MIATKNVFISVQVNVYPVSVENGQINLPSKLQKEIVIHIKT